MIFDTPPLPPSPSPEALFERAMFGDSDSVTDDNVAWAAGLGRSVQHREDSPSIESLLLRSPDDEHNDVQTAPLKSWIQTQGNHQDLSRLNLNSDPTSDGITVALRKLTVAYAIGSLLHHHKKDCSRLSILDNYCIRFDSSAEAESGWEVLGLDTISPPLNIGLTFYPTNFNDVFGAKEGDDMGRNVETKIESKVGAASSQLDGGSDEKGGDDAVLCYTFGTVMHDIFSGEFSEGKTDKISSESREQRQFKSNSMPSQRCTSGLEEGSNGVHDSTEFLPLGIYGCPSAISQLVQNLLDCKPESNPSDGSNGSNDACPSLDAALKDIHMLLEQPLVFLSEPIAPHAIQTNDKFYGRTQESKDLTDAFCRVALDGRSEAFIIGGFSGCGKTRLIQSVFGSVTAGGGIIIAKKFDETSTNQLSIVLSAFNDLCLVIANKQSAEDNQLMYEKLLSEFGENYFLSLVRTLPNVLEFSSLSSETVGFGEWAVNFFSLCDIIKRFMRVVTKVSWPVMLVLDDMQWADPVSLGLVHTVLSDTPGESSMFFVGSYRDNEVKPDHIIFGFLDKLAEFDVKVKRIHLDGMPKSDVNMMISHALKILPRLCQPLSQVVFIKTNGSPFFIQEFLWSLLDKGLLKFSLREKCLTWDCDKILAEDVTANVLDLITAKMKVLPSNVQNALKVASCFGITMKGTIAKALSNTDQYADLLTDLNKAVADRIVEKDGHGNYKFGHDKVREAAFSMIGTDCRDRYHFEIGVSLISQDDKSDTLFDIVEQINHGVPALVQDDSQRISIVKLNFEAGSQAMMRSYFISAYTYASTAHMLLPEDSWNTLFDLSLRVHFQLAKAAYSNGKIDEARDALEKIVNHSNVSVESKIDAYELLADVLFSTFDEKDIDQYVFATLRILKSFGEDILIGNVAPGYINTQISMTKKRYENVKDETLLSMDKPASNRNLSIMKTYDILARVSYIAKPSLFPYYASKWAQFCLKSKAACKQVSNCLLTFASVLCENIDGQDVHLAYRVGKLGMRVYNEHYSANLEQLPYVYLMFYGFVACLFEPIQAVVDMQRRACEVGVQMGVKSMVANHKYFIITRQLHAGTNLRIMKKEVKRDLKMTKEHSWPVLGMRLKLHCDMIESLIGESTSSRQRHDTSTVFNETIQAQYGQMIVSTYLGYFSRVKHLAEKYLSEGYCWNKKINLRFVYVAFYYALALLNTQRERGTKRISDEVDEMIGVVANASELSEWNFKNKFSLLLAEKNSTICFVTTKSISSPELIETLTQYDTAIELSKTSKFVHEEGLSCELAGLHHERQGNTLQAMALFQRAKQCYDDWGSLIKANKMAEKIAGLSNAL